MELCAICCFGSYELGETSKEVVDSVKLALVNNGFIYKCSVFTFLCLQQQAYYVI